LAAALDLTRIILGSSWQREDDARDALENALALEAEPFAYFAHRFDLTDTLVMARAASWAGVAMVEALPPQAGRELPHRLEGLRDQRLVTHAGISYVAPDFAQALRLGALVQRNPVVAERLRFVTGRTMRAHLGKTLAGPLLDNARQGLARLWPKASGHLDLSLAARIGFVLVLAAIIAGAAVGPYWFEFILLPLMALLLLPPALLRLYVALRPPSPQAEAPPLGDDALPIYTIMVPLRDEAHMVPQLARTLQRLDYPPEKLDVKFVVEDRSIDTLRQVRGVLDDPRFELIEVPNALPHTKPKALNFALPFVRGEFVVVYDAEDIPEPDQLRRAASLFAHHPALDCVQAELVIENAEETWLTRLFAGEYAGQFGLLLPLLGRLNLPMPLGGTSNHFRTSALREVGGWDAFNVTEDADLGVRLSRLRYRTGTIASRTFEEAPLTLTTWMRQRTRWMKGWMKTYIVHNMHPIALWRDMGWRNFLVFQIYVGNLIICAPLHTVFLLVLGLRLMLTGDIPMAPLYWIVLVTGYVAAFSISVAGLVRNGQKRLLWFQALLPIYWVLHSFAALRAARELLIAPYFWGKTTHGRTRVSRGMTSSQIRAKP